MAENPARLPKFLRLLFLIVDLGSIVPAGVAAESIPAIDPALVLARLAPKAGK